MTRMDGRAAADFDVIDRFVVAHGLDLEITREAIAFGDADLARMLVNRRFPRRAVRLGAGSPPPSSRGSSGSSTPSS